MTLYLNGRVIEYTNEVIYETDFLRSNLYHMVAVSKLAETILGNGNNNNTVVYGFPCAPVSPPGLSVTVGVGSIYTFSNLDDSPYGVLPADTNPNHRLYKQGINFDPVTLSTPAPTTPGNSVIHLVQAVLQDIDKNIVNREYFNSANPNQTINESAPDTRACLANVTLKQGIEAPSPTAPAPDAGYIGLYYVAVTYAQSSISSGNITKISTIEGSPFVTEGLLSKFSKKQMYASVYLSSSQTYTADADTLIQFDQYPAGGNAFNIFNPSTHLMTIPQGYTGLWGVCSGASFSFSGYTSVGTELSLNHNGTEIRNLGDFGESGSVIGNIHIPGNYVEVYFNAGDTVGINANSTGAGTTKTTTILGNQADTYFSIRYLGV